MKITKSFAGIEIAILGDVFGLAPTEKTNTLAE